MRSAHPVLHAVPSALRWQVYMEGAIVSSTSQWRALSPESWHNFLRPHRYHRMDAGSGARFLILVWADPTQLPRESGAITNPFYRPEE